MIRYDEHADFQLERRGIAKDWVEQTIRAPEVTETKGIRRVVFALYSGTSHHATRGDTAA
jgi:hypothetical protein